MPFAKREDGGFIRAINYKAGEGKLTIVKRVLVDDVWCNSLPIDISDGFEATFDFLHAEVGWFWIRKADERPKNAPPVLSLNVAPLNGATGKRPARGYQQGFRIRMLLSEGVGDESVRELLSTAACVWESVGKFFENHIEKYLAEHPDQLPVVAMRGTVPFQVAKGIVHAPQFELVRWVARPEELPDVPMTPIGSDWGGGSTSRNDADIGAPPKWHDDVPPNNTPPDDEDLDSKIPF
jgi:hypothetical protein